MFHLVMEAAIAIAFYLQEDINKDFYKIYKRK